MWRQWTTWLLNPWNMVDIRPCPYTLSPQTCAAGNERRRTGSTRETGEDSRRAEVLGHCWRRVRGYHLVTVARWKRGENLSNNSRNLVTGWAILEGKIRRYSTGQTKCRRPLTGNFKSPLEPSGGTIVIRETRVSRKQSRVILADKTRRLVNLTEIFSLHNLAKQRRLKVLIVFFFFIIQSQILSALKSMNFIHWSLVAQKPRSLNHIFFIVATAGAV